METKEKSQNSLILILLVIVAVSALLTVGVLMYTRGRPSDLNTKLTTSTESTYVQEIYPAEGSTTLELVETGELEYDLVINTNEDEITGADIKFEYDNSKIDINVENANLKDLNEPFSANKEKGVLSIEVGTLNSFKGKGTVAKIKLSKLTGFVPTTLVLSDKSQVFVNDELEKNYLSPLVMGYTLVIN